MLRLVTILAALSLSACASVTPQMTLPAAERDALALETARQQDAALAAEQIRFERVHGVWWRLITANHELCADQAHATGFTLHSLNSYPVEFRDAAAARFGIGVQPAIDFVAPGSGAQAAGLQQNDVLVAVNGEAIRIGDLNRRSGRRDRAAEDAYDKLDAALEGGGAVQLNVLRAGVPLSVTLTPTPVCDYELVIVRDDRVNAAANGRIVAITTGILRYLDTDSELAVVLGHELGHNALEHREQRDDATRAGRWGGAALGILLGAATGVYVDFGAMAAGGTEEMRLNFEREADYAGIYFAARAGYDTTGVEQFWRRFAADYPMSTYLNDTHPTAPERFLNIAAAQAEIEAKRRAGEDLRLTPAAP